ncbi:MAG: Phage tail tape measure protein [Bifidobacterium crudilactis]|jgi:hypothetical protein|uniref:hypothetical protein n=1 Tax=Bifidobacterium crudilactis TaxID=327277 RepID=UPI003A5C5072
MSDTATEVGSIKGLLKLDISDYMAGIQQAKAAEDELKHGDDDIRIDADVSEAIAKIDEVSAKTDKVTSKDGDIRIDADTDQAVAKIESVEAKTDKATSNTDDIHIDANVSEATAKLDQVLAQADQVDSERIDLRVQASVDEALAEIQAVAAKTEQVTAVRHEILVDADTGTAVAQIEAVSAAQAQLDSSTARLRAAYSQLDAVQSKGVASQSALMVAEAAATQVEQEQADAQERLSRVLAENNVALLSNAASQSVNSEAASSAARSASEQASSVTAGRTAMASDTAATSANTAAKDANRSATDSQAKSYGALRGSLLLVAPALLPIAGAAAGAGAALVGMAGAGILAYKGISNAVDAASVTGRQYSADLHVIEDGMSSLANTSAVAYLQGFNGVTRELNSQMPYLSRLTATFSRDLGTISSNGVAGLLGLFRQLQPVMLSVDQGIVRASASFARWGTGNGARDFVAYLIEKLPSVENALGSLFGAAGHVVQAFSPWSGVVLSTVTAVSDVISAIPTPVLSTLVTEAMAVYTAFKLWNGVTSVFDKVKTGLGSFSAALGLSSTGVGLFIAGVTALSAVIAMSQTNVESAAQAQTDYASALENTNGVIDESVRKQAAKKLQEQGAYDMASSLGISSKDLTDAVLGEGDAYDRVSGQVNEAATHYHQLAIQTRSNKDGTSKLAKQSDELSKILGNQHSGLQSAVNDQKQIAEATGDASSKISSQSQILGVSQSEWNTLTTAESNASTAAKDYKSALDALNGQAQTLDQATNSLTTQFDTMASTLQQNIKNVGTAQATSMDNNTTYGAKNHQLILQTVQDAQAKADAIINSEGKSQKSYADARASLEESRQKILDTAKANGLNTDEVSKYLDQVMKIPPSTSTSIILDDSDATAGLSALQVKTATLSADSKTVTITGDNADALAKIATIEGAKIDPKTGTLTLNKTQYESALALANGAKIDPKTGQLLGDNNPILAKIAQTNMWTIDPKTGQIRGEDGNFITVANRVEAYRLNPKSVAINGDASGFYAVLRQISSANVATSVGVSTSLANLMRGGYTGGMFDGSKFLPGYANGGQFEGAVSGPASPVRDSVILRNARLDPGEHVLTKKDVQAMGGQRAVYAFRSSLHSSNQGYANGGSPSKSDSAHSTPYLPETITLVDADGSLLAKVRTIADQRIQRHNTNLVRGIVNG